MICCCHRMVIVSRPQMKNLRTISVVRCAYILVPMRMPIAGKSGDETRDRMYVS